MMNKRRIIWIAAGLALSGACKEASRKLPVYGNREAVEKIIGGKKVTDTVYQVIPPFNFVNQDSLPITNEQVKGKMYVADFFFTSCPSICPVMHRNLKRVYDEYKGDKDIMFVSFSIDYKYDVPHVLKKYAKKLGVDGPQWQFIHGSRDSIYALAKNNYLVAVNEDGRAPGGYTHQGYLVLVDGKGRVRGSYDGTNSDQVQQLIKDMEVLREEDKVS